MKTKYKRVLNVLLFLLALLFLALPFYRPAEVPVLFLLFGRVHPLVLHFPIVLILLALLLELAGRFQYLKKTQPIVRLILIAAVLSTFVSVCAGFFLFASGDYSGDLMETHFWAGSVTGALVLATAALFNIYQETGRYYSLYFAGLIASSVTVGYAGHVGGTITHGKDFLTAYLPAVMNKWKDQEDKPEDQMLLYEDVITPILEFKCASCHNTTRAKGGYIVIPYQNVVKAGESGHRAVTPESLEKSELFHRISLPEVHEDHMPPEGKTPLSSNEIALIKYWIEKGASDKLTVPEARTTESMRPVMSELMVALTNYHRRSTIAKMKADALNGELREIAEKLSIVIHRDSISEGDYFTLSMNFPPTPFGDDQLKALMPYAEHFSGVSVVSSGITDEALYYIGQMANVKELYLQKTGLDGSGLIYLQKLTHLEILNLSFTNIDDRALIDLLKIPSLREVYLYRTKTSAAVIEAIRKNRPGLSIVIEEGPYL